MDPLLSIPVAFLGGIAAFASPCFLPIVPVFLATLIGSPAVSKFPALASASSASGFIDYRGNQSQKSAACGKSSPQGSARYGAMQALWFVAAFSFVFIGLWILIATFGFLVADWKNYLLPVGGATLILMGLIQTGLLKFPNLAASSLWQKIAGRKAGTGRSILLGLSFGLGWSPCIGPTLGAIIGLAMTTGSLIAGTWLLVVFCLGLGAPLVFLAAGLSKATKSLAWLNRHSRTIKIASGVLLLAVGLLMITGLFAQVAALSWITL